MVVLVAGFRSRSWLVLALCTALCGACGDEAGSQGVSVGDEPDDIGSGEAGSGDTDDMGATEPSPDCDRVELDGDYVVEHEEEFTARYLRGEPVTKTIMIFGGDPVTDANVLSNAFIVGLDKKAAQMLAEKYADFHLCSSPGVDEASAHIIPYELVPASCEIYDQLVKALRQYHKNVASGGDRTSLRFEGAPLELESVIEDVNGQDVTDQVTGMDFHLVTSVEQLTGESLLDFGNSE
jgi:hypothetical protein